MLGNYVDAPFANPESGFITADLWTLISQEILNQCDSLDGLVDGILSELDDCKPNFESLLCGDTTSTTTCLNTVQRNALGEIYSPLYESDGKELMSRLDPGSDNDGNWQVQFSRQVSDFSNVSISISAFSGEVPEK